MLCKNTNQEGGSQSTEDANRTAQKVLFTSKPRKQRSEPCGCVVRARGERFQQSKLQRRGGRINTGGRTLTGDAVWWEMLSREENSGH